MSNFFKKKNAKHQELSGEDVDGLGASHQRFLSKFGKKNTSNTLNTSTVDDPQYESLYEHAHTSPPDLTKPDYYSPPTATSLREDDFGHTSYNTSNWYSLNGRVGRVQLLAFGVIWGLITTLLYIIGTLLGSVLGPGAISIILAIISVFTLPAAIYSYIILPRRRLHDIGKSGWWLLLLIVPLINILLLLYMYFARGDDGVNAYGMPPAPYTQTELWLALLLPIMAIIGIAAAILLPNLLDDSILGQMAPTDDTIIVEGSDSPANANPSVDTTPAASETPEVTAPVAEEAAADAQPANDAEPEINVVEQPVVDTQAPISFEEFKQEAQTTIYREEAEAAPAQ